MAELNVDKDLIDKSAILQSDKVIAMQNGCVVSAKISLSMCQVNVNVCNVNVCVQVKR